MFNVKRWILWINHNNCDCIKFFSKNISYEIFYFICIQEDRKDISIEDLIFQFISQQFPRFLKNFPREL